MPRPVAGRKTSWLSMECGTACVLMARNRRTQRKQVSSNSTGGLQAAATHLGNIADHKQEIVVRAPPIEVGAFNWTVLAPDIVNPGREEQGSVSV